MGRAIDRLRAIRERFLRAVELEETEAVRGGAEEGVEGGGSIAPEPRPKTRPSGDFRNFPNFPNFGNWRNL